MVITRNAKNKIIKLLGIRTIIVVLPLLVIIVFSFSYISLTSLHLQRTLAGKKLQQSTDSSSFSTLPLTVTPILPKLDQDLSTAGGSDSNATPSTSTSLDTNNSSTYSGAGRNNSNSNSNVGPSSKNSGDILQNVNNSKNDELQATRQAVQLDKLVP